MSFDHWAYVREFQERPGNRAGGYGVEVLPAVLPANLSTSSAVPDFAGLPPGTGARHGSGTGQGVWRCIGVHHLWPQENLGKHHIYVEVIDEGGARIPGAILLIFNHDGGVRGRMTVDKPLHEPGTNTHIHSNETLGLQVEGLPSDRVAGIHTRHADEPGGNTLGHHSFLVVFQLKPSTSSPPPPDPPAPPQGGEELARWFEEMDATMRRFAELAKEWEELR